jgi:hypothetical protein
MSNTSPPAPRDGQFAGASHCRSNAARLPGNRVLFQDRPRLKQVKIDKEPADPAKTQQDTPPGWALRTRLPCRLVALARRCASLPRPSTATPKGRPRMAREPNWFLRHMRTVSACIKPLSAAAGDSPGGAPPGPPRYPARSEHFMPPITSWWPVMTRWRRLRSPWRRGPSPRRLTSTRSRRGRAG